VLSNEQTDTVEHDVLLCILELMRSKFIKATGKIRIGHDLADTFNRRLYEEYSDRKDNESHSSLNVMKYQTYKISDRKIGWYVRRMGLKVDRNREGFFIPIFTEYPKIKALAERYGLNKLYELPDDPLKIQETKDPKEQKLPEGKTITEVEDDEMMKKDENIIGVIHVKELPKENPHTENIGGEGQIQNEVKEYWEEDKKDTPTGS
jgi:hypothetical protein